MKLPVPDRLLLHDDQKHKEQNLPTFQAIL